MTSDRILAISAVGDHNLNNGHTGPFCIICDLVNTLYMEDTFAFAKKPSIYSSLIAEGINGVVIKKMSRLRHIRIVGILN